MTYLLSATEPKSAKCPQNACIFAEDTEVFTSLRVAVVAHCGSALYRLQARVHVLLSPLPRAYCVRWLV